MIKTILPIFALVLTVGAETLPLPTNFVHAIHQVETCGKRGPILGDNGKALGPLQIHKGAWLDAWNADHSLGGKYEDCKDLDYSRKVMTAYLNRYAQKAILSNDFETLARKWNGGGPKGETKSATLPYWNKVKKYL